MNDRNAFYILKCQWNSCFCIYQKKRRVPPLEFLLYLPPTGHGSHNFVRVHSRDPPTRKCSLLPGVLYNGFISERTFISYIVWYFLYSIYICHLTVPARLCVFISEYFGRAFSLIMPKHTCLDIYRYLLISLRRFYMHIRYISSIIVSRKSLAWRLF